MKRSIFILLIILSVILLTSCTRIFSSISGAIGKGIENAIGGALDDVMGGFTLDINDLMTDEVASIDTGSILASPEEYAKHYGFNVVSITPDGAAEPYMDNGLIFMPGDTSFDTDSLDPLIRYAYKLYTAAQAVSDDGKVLNSDTGIEISADELDITINGFTLSYMLNGTVCDMTVEFIQTINTDSSEDGTAIRLVISGQ